MIEGGVKLTYRPTSCIRGCHIIANYHAVARRGPMGCLRGGQDGWIRSVERYEEAAGGWVHDSGAYVHMIKEMLFTKNI